MGDNTNQLVYILSKLILFDIASVSFPVVLHWNERGKLAGRWEWTEFYYGTPANITHVWWGRTLAIRDYSRHRNSAVSTEDQILHRRRQLQWICYTSSLQEQAMRSIDPEIWDLKSEIWIRIHRATHGATHHQQPQRPTRCTPAAGQPVWWYFILFNPPTIPFCFHK